MDTSPAPAPTRMPRKRRDRLAALDRLDDLLEEVVETEVSGGHAESTAETYQRIFGRYSAWCLKRRWDPYAYSPARLGMFVVAELAPCSQSYAKMAFRGVSHRWVVERGHPRLVVGRNTFVGRVARGVARSQSHPRSHNEAKALDAAGWAKILTVEPPAPAARTVELRAGLLAVWHAGAVWSAKSLQSIDLATVRVGERRVRLRLGETDVVMPATGKADCPVAAWRALLDLGWDGWTPDADQPFVSKPLYEEVRSITTAPALRLPHLPGARQKTAASAVLSEDDVARVCTVADHGEMLWLHDQTVLLWQLLGGYRGDTMRKLTVGGQDGGHAEFTTSDEHGESVTVRTGAHKGDQTDDRRHTNTLPGRPKMPLVCVVRLTRTWWWAMGLEPGDPVFPVRSHRTIYSRSGHRAASRKTAAQLFAAPIKRRAKALEWATKGLAATTGRKSLPTEADAAGIDLVAIAEHMGHASLRSTSHYVVVGSRRAAASRMATSISDLTLKDV